MAGRLAVSGLPVVFCRSMEPLDHRQHLEIFEARPSSVEIRPVARWLSDTWGKSMGYSLAETEAECRRIADSPLEALLVARRSDTLVGTASVVACDLEGFERFTPWLSSLYVRPSSRGTGIGSALEQAACRWSKARGHQQFYLYCRSGRLSDYYADLGWTPQQALELSAGSFSLMRKEIAAGE